MFCAGLFSMCRSPALLNFLDGTLGAIQHRVNYKYVGTVPEIPEPASPTMCKRYSGSRTFSTQTSLGWGDCGSGWPGPQEWWFSRCYDRRVRESAHSAEAAGVKPVPM